MLMEMAKVKGFESLPEGLAKRSLSRKVTTKMERQE